MKRLTEGDLGGSMDMADMYSEKPVLDEMERYEETFINWL